MTRRAIPQNISMGEPVQFGQHFTYFDAMPIERMIEPDFLLPVRSMIRVGDLLRLMELNAEGTAVLREADACVARFDGESPVVVLRGPVLDIAGLGVGKAGQDAEPLRYAPEGATKVNRGATGWEIRHGGKVIARAKDEAGADAILSGLVPLPQSQPEAA